VPLAAGVAVIALAISLVVIKDLRSGPVVVSPPGPATVSGVPPYYVTLYSPPQPTPDTDRPAGKIVPWHLGWLSNSVAATKAARPVYAFTVDAPSGSQGWLYALWSNASGSTIIGSWYFGSSTTPPEHFGVMSQGTFRALPVPPTITDGGATPTIAW
jgi:hypothetical protein